MKIKINNKNYEIEPFKCHKNHDGKFPFYINITNACNAKCEFCSNSKKDAKDLNYKELKEILEKIHDKISRFAISGGEPLLDSKKLKKVLDIINPYNIMITINTNGYFLEQNVDLLNQYKNIKSIQLSRHHYEDELNNKLFKVDTIPLKKIKDLKLNATININCLLIKGYIDSLEKVYKYLDILHEETNITELGFISMMKVNDYTKENYIDYHILLDELNKEKPVFYNNKNFYLDQNTVEVELLKDDNRCSCANYIYVTKDKKQMHLFFRYTEEFGHCGKRSLFYDSNGLSEGY